MVIKSVSFVFANLILIFLIHSPVPAFEDPGAIPPGGGMPPGQEDVPPPAEEEPAITEPEPLLDEELEPRDPSLEDPLEEDEALNRVYARVGGRVITKADYRREFGTTEVDPERLKWLIDELLIEVAAEEVGVQITDEEVEELVEQQINQIRMQAGEEGFQRQLQMEGLTETEFREQMMKEFKRQQKLSAVLFAQYPELQPEEGEPAMASPTRPRARIMLLESSKVAEEAYDRLAEGEAWETVFEEKSRQLAFMGDAGDLGWFDWGDYARELEYRTFELPLFGISKPFEFQGEKAIVQKTGSRLIPPWEEVSVRAQETWSHYRLEYYQERLVELLRDEYAVHIPSDLEVDLPEYGSNS